MDTSPESLKNFQKIDFWRFFYYLWILTKNMGNFFLDRIFCTRRIFYNVEIFFRDQWYGQSFEIFFRWIAQILMIAETLVSLPKNPIFGQKGETFFYRIFWCRRIFYEVKKKKNFLQLEYYQISEIFFQMNRMKIDETR